MRYHAHTTTTVRAALASIGLACVTACAAVQPTSSSRMSVDFRQSMVLLPDDIARANVGTVYDVVERLRPGFLQGTRGESAFNTRRVYVDGMWIGGLSELRTISSVNVREVRFLSAIEATSRFGTGNSAGAVLVTTINARGR